MVLSITLFAQQDQDKVCLIILNHDIAVIKLNRVLIFWACLIIAASSAASGHFGQAERGDLILNDSERHGYKRAGHRYKHGIQLESTRGG